MESDKEVAQSYHRSYVKKRSFLSPKLHKTSPIHKLSSLHPKGKHLKSNIKLKRKEITSKFKAEHKSEGMGAIYAIISAT